MILVQTENKVRRGRPCGAQTAVVADGQLGNHHFAFLRSVAEGLDPGQCAERYLVGQERVDPRTARVIQRQLLDRVLAVAKALNDLGLREASEQLTAAEADTLPKSQQLPSLGEFADTLDSDMYSESDLIELYQEQYGSVDTSTEAFQRVKVKALDYLQGRLAKTPQGEDSLAQWLPVRLCSPLRVHGVLTLNNLVTFIRRSGRTWYRLIPRLGRGRAARLESWLTDNQYLGQGLMPTGSTTVASLSTAMMPLEQLCVPPALNGSDGAFRADQVNTLGAETDQQAIEAWLKLLASNSAHTQVAYRREVERFYLWTLLEKRKALSSLDALDCESYKAFLHNPPPHWVCALPYPRSHRLWRPFRGPLSASSLQRSLAAVTRLFSDLVSAQYLRANPMPRMHAHPTSVVHLDVMRSFTIEDQESIAGTLHALPDSPSSRRTKALVMLLLSAGLRVSETNTTCGAIFKLREHEHLSENFGLRILGKGNKERIVPLRAEVLAALKAHHADLGEICTIPADQLPLIGTLYRAPNTARIPSKRLGEALSAAGMYSVLKSFFAKVGKLHSSQVDFEKASAHWMRHTFAHQVLAATDNDLAVVQQLLGHSSIQTTAIYVKANMQSRTLAINAMESPLFKLG